jgi:hypothetical protein
MMPSTEELTALRALYAECYKEFEASGFDTLVITIIQRKIVRFFQEETERKQKTREKLYAGNWQSHWRLFLEYCLQRIPLEQTTVRELLMERVRNTWAVQLLDKQRDNDNQRMERLERILHNSIDDVFDKLIYYEVVKDGMRLEDGTQLEETQDGQYEFGTLEKGVLTWNKPANQLARVIHKIETHLEYESLAAYEIARRVEKSGVVRLARGQFETVKKALENIHSRKADFGEEHYVPQAAIMLLSLLKQR